MFDMEGEWSISLAGCGFLGVYYIGLASCFLELAPFLVKKATRIYGASSGALTAMVLALGMPLDKCCEDLMGMARAARGRSLGALHPSFDLVKIVRDSLNRDLPTDAHLLATGRLCVSLTRVSDGRNVLVSEFSSREELIQALVCSCFIPVYCGLIPPSFRGVRYMDGALSNNQPQYELKNTITVAPFSGNCIICPRDEAFRLHTIRFCSASFHVNLLNVWRVARVFFPPEPQIMAEICQNGYKDGLQFLKENNLLRLSRPSSGLSISDDTGVMHACCCGNEIETLEPFTSPTESKDRHWWLDKRITENLPVPIKKVFCEACREKHRLYSQMTVLLPVRMASYVLLPYTLPVESAYSIIQRLVQWLPQVAGEVRWLFRMAADVYWQTLNGEGLKVASKALQCQNEPLPLDLQAEEREEDDYQLPLSVAPPRNDRLSMPSLPLTPPPTSSCRSFPETTPPSSSSFASAPAGKTTPPAKAHKDARMLSLKWATQLLSPATLDPIL